MGLASYLGRDGRVEVGLPRRLAQGGGTVAHLATRRGGKDEGEDRMRDALRRGAGLVRGRDPGGVQRRGRAISGVAGGRPCRSHRRHPGRSERRDARSWRRVPCHPERRDRFRIPGHLPRSSALSARALSPRCELFGVEPAAGNDGQRSFRAGEIVHIDTPHTIADGAQTQHLGAITFAIIRREVKDVLTVDDRALVDAMRFFFTYMKLVIEPTGCLGFSAALQRREQVKGKRIGVILSGGNIDASRFSQLVG